MTPEIKKRIQQVQQGDVPEEYKHSAMGIIPEDWEIHSVGDHLTESYILGNTGDVAKKITVKLWNKGVVEKKEVHTGSENTQYYTRKSGQFIYSKLDFLNCAFGIVPEELDGYESTLDLPAFDIDGINSYYLLSQVTQRRFYEHWGIMAANGGRKARRISPEDFLSFPIAFPCIQEQNKITEVLTAQNTVIKLMGNLIDEKKRQKKALMQQLLTGKKRLPGFTGEWHTIALSEISRKITEKNTDFKYDVVFSNSAQNGIIPQNEQFDKDIANDDNIDKYYVVSEGCFVYNPRISVTAPCGPINVNHNLITGVMSPLYTVFSVDDKNIDNDYLEQYFESTIWFRYMKSVANYGARHDRMSITDEDFFNMLIKIGDIKEQHAIKKVLLAADSEIELLQKDLDLEKQKKKALMQLLLTGIVRTN